MTKNLRKIQLFLSEHISYSLFADVGISIKFVGVFCKVWPMEQEILFLASTVYQKKIYIYIYLDNILPPYPLLIANQAFVCCFLIIFLPIYLQGSSM